MRTIKALVCAAALAAGLATVTAQTVYSLNVVGYYNVPCAAGAKVLLANQLNTTNNTLAQLIPNGPPAAQFFKYAGGFSAYVFDDIDMAWLPNGNATMNPGEGAFYLSPTATTLTFVGEVLQGNLVNTLPINQKVIRSSMVPQAGLITTDLQLPGEPADQLFTYSGGYSAYVFDDIDMAWLPNQPTINVGQAFFYIKAAASVSSAWTRNFTVQ